MMSKPETFQGDLANLPPALLPLTEQKRWLVWRWESRTTKNGKQKWTKPPYQALYPSLYAKSNDPDTWSSHRAAVAAVERGEADGIGFALMDSRIGAVDLDHCINRDSSMEPWAEQLHAEADGAYKETTVSGTGLRFIGTAEGRTCKQNLHSTARPAPASSSIATPTATSPSAASNAGHAQRYRRSTA